METNTKWLVKKVSIFTNNKNLSCYKTLNIPFSRIHTCNILDRSKAQTSGEGWYRESQLGMKTQRLNQYALTTFKNFCDNPIRREAIENEDEPTKTRRSTYYYSVAIKV